MKKITVLLICSLLSVYSFGQDNNFHRDSKQTSYKHKTKKPAKSSKVYINVSTGINNNSGLIGFGVDVPVWKYISIEGDAGISSWGSKIAGSCKYYLKPGHRGWAFGAGATYNSGINNYTSNLQTIDGDTEPVTLNLNPQMNIFVAAYYFWQLRGGKSRFYLEAGWSVPLTPGDRFDQTYGTPITSDAQATMNLLSPGGLIIGAGFAFGIK